MESIGRRALHAAGHTEPLAVSLKKEDVILPSDAARASTNPHLAYLDGFRAIAALFVLLHHIWIQIWGADPHRHPGGWIIWVTGWILYGHFAVDLFIVLSGFCLMLPVIRNNGVLIGGHRLFFWKRIRRILPTYYASVLFSLLLIHFCIGKHSGSQFDSATDVNLWSISAVLLLVQDVFIEVAGGKINPAYWSIAVEWHIYFLFPLLVYCCRRFGIARTFLLTASAAYWVDLLGNQTYVHGLNLQYVALFMMGMLAAKIAYDPAERWAAFRETFPWREGCLSAAIFLTAFCLANGWRRVTMVFSYVDFIVGFCCLCLLVITSKQQTSRLTRFLQNRTLVFIGGFAYSLYLIHQPLLQVIWEHLLVPLHLSRTLTFVLLVLIGMPTAVGCAYLFYLCFERPFLSSRNRRAVPLENSLPRTI